MTEIYDDMPIAEPSDVTSAESAETASPDIYPDPSAEAHEAEETVEATRADRSAAEDILELCLDFPEMRAQDVCRITSDKRYSELRCVGLTPREAFLATSKPKSADNRSHLVTGVPSGAKVHTSGMTSWEMSCARALFSDLPESEIKRLYAKVTTQNH